MQLDMWAEESFACRPCQSDRATPPDGSRNVANYDRIVKHYLGYNSISADSISRYRIYPHILEIKTITPLIPTRPNPARRRGEITGFSAASRTRMFRLLAKLRDTGITAPIHITLTYHDEWMRPGADHARDLHTWLTAMSYHCPSGAYIWRLEAQRRGAPHYHVMYWPETDGSTINTERVKILAKLAWHRIAEPDSKLHLKHGVKVTEITDYKMACAYLSKYIAKEAQDADDQLKGRRWGASRNLPIDEIERGTLTREQAALFARLIRRWFVSRHGQSSVFFGRLSYATSYHIFMAANQIERLLEYVMTVKPHHYTDRETDNITLSTVSAWTDQPQRDTTRDYIGRFYR